MLQARIEHLPQTAGTEGSRRLTGVPAVETIPPDVEVVIHKIRRRLTVDYKVRVIETVAELKASGSSSIGTYLRKEGLYYSSVHKWMQ